MKRFQRFVALLLVMVLVLPMVPASAFATTEETETSVTEQIVSAEETAVETFVTEPEVTQISGQIPVQVNPLYADVLSAEDIEVSSAPVQLLTEPVYGTVEEAAAMLREGLKARASEVTVYVQTTADAYEQVFYDVLDCAMLHSGNPTEGDYLKYQYAGYGGGYGGQVDSLGNYYITYQYYFEYHDSADQQDTMDAAVNALLAQLNLDGKSDYEKVCGIYDWMCANITYDYDNLEDESYRLKYTAYAALVNKTAVCQGYANLFYRLALALGVDSRIISGKGNGGAHAWNIAKLNGSYYDLDATWDATWKQAGLDYGWFLKSETNFSADHVRDSQYTTTAFNAAYPMATKDYDPLDYILASGTCGDNLTWVLDTEGVLTISGEGAMDDYPLASNTPWYEYKSNIKTVIICDGVTNIGNYAFFKCYSLTSVTISDSVSKIGSNAFYACSNLVSVVIPDGVTHIGNDAFQSCDSLNSVLLPESLVDIGKGAFCHCYSLRAITIPASVVSIGASAFDDCYDLSNVVISNGVASIGDEAFWHCSSLRSITIPASVTHIGGGVFGECSELIAIEVDAENPKYANDDKGVLYNKTFTELVQVPGTFLNFTVPDGVTSIGNGAFAGCFDIVDITLPDGITNIGDKAFYRCSALKSVDIPEGVTRIGDLAFSQCKNITSITIPQSVICIESYAFDHCTGLTDITIMDGIESIYDYAFYYCSALTSVTLPKSVTGIWDWAFCECTNLKEIYFEGDVPNIGRPIFGGVTATAYYPADNEGWESAIIVKVWGGTITWVPYGEEQNYSKGLEYALSEDGVYYIVSGIGTCTDTDIIIPTNHEGLPVKEIGTFAFSNCANLISVTIPNSVTSIGNSAFRNCSSLISVKISNSVINIGNHAFYNCENLISMEIPNSVTSIGSCAFSWCDGLTEIVVDESNTAYSSDEFGVLFNKDKTTLICCPGAINGTYTIPDSVTSIDSYAFYECGGLTGVEIPNSITSIGGWAFEYCDSLTSVTIPNTVTSIGKAAFRSCYSLTSVEIPDSVTSIDWQTFGSCIKLTSVTIPDSVTSIGSSAFAYCTRLTSVEIPNSVTSIGGWAFDSCDGLTSITIPDSVTSIGSCAFNSCNSLTEIVVDSANTAYSSDEFGVLFNKDKTILVCCPGGKPGTYTIPNSVTSIEDGAFEWCGRLTRVEIPNTVTSIIDSMFWCCTRLTSIDIPDSITSIGKHAFYNCDSLTSVTVSNSVISIGDNAFLECGSLGEIRFEGDVPTFGGSYVFSNVTATAYYPAGNETWTSDVMQNYGGTITWVAYETAEAMIGGVRYDTLAEALAAAQPGDTVILTADTSISGNAIVRTGVTLDLNGYTLESDYVFAVNGSHIIDSSEENTGILAVDANRVMISSTNAQLPVWNGEGYVFTTVTYKTRLMNADHDSLKFAFLPQFKSSATALLEDGVDGNKVTIEVRVSWMTTMGHEYRNLVFNENQVDTVVGTNGAFILTFSGFSQLSMASDITVEGLVISETGVNIACEPEIVSVM